MIMLNILLLKNFTARFKQENLASKNHIDNIIKKTDFDTRLLSFNKRINSHKTKHLLVENESNEAVSINGLTKDLVNG